MTECDECNEISVRGALQLNQQLHRSHSSKTVPAAHLHTTGRYKEKQENRTPNRQSINVKTSLLTTTHKQTKQLQNQTTSNN
jgi:hypothetical protein